MPKPSLFIGSSSEGIVFARAIRSQLSEDAEVTIWDDDFFPLSSTFIESLVNLSPGFDFAILILTADDLVNSRNTESFGPRDNVIFELGLFMGVLGRARCFIINPANAQVKIPSDLSGVATAKYDWPRDDNDYEAAVSKACNSIRKVIRELGFSDRNTQKQLNRVQEEQATQKKNIDALSFLVSYFVPKQEIEHLKKLFYSDRFDYELHESFSRELRHLLDMEFIRKRHSFAFRKLPAQGNLKDFFEVTAVGKNFLDMRDGFPHTNERDDEA